MANPYELRFEILKMAREYLQDQTGIAENHADTDHAIQGTIGFGIVHSHHHQAMTTSGNLMVAARADDGMIEAIQDESRSWYVGVQWHPERTTDGMLGQGLFDQLVAAAQSGVTI